jgi:hypothetical protein
MEATATFSLNTGLVVGFVKFTQESPDGATRVDVNLTGAVGSCPTDKFGVCNYGEYHVHEFAVDSASLNGPCSVQSVGGHYNPLNKPLCNFKEGALVDPTAVNNRGDCELGDLSGKFGLLPSSGFIQSYSDDFLPLSGPYSILGRSVVVHDMQGLRWVCATIMPVVVWPSSGFACAVSDVTAINAAVDRIATINELVVSKPTCVNCLRSCGDTLDPGKCSAMCVSVTPAAHRDGQHECKYITRSGTCDRCLR